MTCTVTVVYRSHGCSIDFSSHHFSFTLWFVGAVVSSVAGGQSETDTFNIKATTALATPSVGSSTAHYCYATLSNTAGIVVDSMRIDFTTTVTVTESVDGSGGNVVTSDSDSASGSDLSNLIETYVQLTQISDVASLDCG